jgi:tRNA pseudouridine38-40 synthase
MTQVVSFWEGGGGLERRLALVVEYDGTCYQGFQLQHQRPTIQGEIEQALKRFTQVDIRIRGASRTDSGAHAQGQVVDFTTAAEHPPDQFLRGLNFYLPADIGIQEAYEVDAEFHSRRSALTRVYRYHVLNQSRPSPIRRNTHHWVKGTLDTAKMDGAAKGLVGEHDFRPLAASHPKEKSAVRRVSRWDVWREGDTVIIECEANGFLRHQIRRANALLVGVGTGKWTESIITDSLKARLPQNWSFPILPAKGLCLMQVTYPDSWQKVKTTGVSRLLAKGQK